jgi:hypothetical protein
MGEGPPVASKARASSTRASAASLAWQRPSGTLQSRVVGHRAAGKRLERIHALAALAGQDESHSPSSLAQATPVEGAGKYWNPTPSPAEPGSRRNRPSASRASCHLVRPPMRYSIEGDWSITNTRSTATGLASNTSAAQVPVMAGGESTEPASGNQSPASATAPGFSRSGAGAPGWGWGYPVPGPPTTAPGPAGSRAASARRARRAKVRDEQHPRRLIGRNDGAGEGALPACQLGFFRPDRAGQSKQRPTPSVSVLVVR